MKKFVFTAAPALAALTLGFAAPAAAAPSGVDSALETISSLEAQGYDVVVTRLSTTPLDRASVVFVGHGQSVTQPAKATAPLYGPLSRTTVHVHVQ